MPVLPPISGHLTSLNLCTLPASICTVMGSEELRGVGGVAKETGEVKVQWSAQVTATSSASLPPPLPWVSSVSLQRQSLFQAWPLCRLGQSSPPGSPPWLPRTVQLSYPSAEHIRGVEVLEFCMVSLAEAPGLNVSQRSQNPLTQPRVWPSPP